MVDTLVSIGRGLSRDKLLQDELRAGVWVGRSRDRTQKKGGKRRSISAPEHGSSFALLDWLEAIGLTFISSKIYKQSGKQT